MAAAVTVPRHLLKISDLTAAEIKGIINVARAVKANSASFLDSMRSRSLVMLFQKPSLRTRLSFEIGMTQMGGHAVYYSLDGQPLGRKESFHDTAQVLSRYADMVMTRFDSCMDTRLLAHNSSVPVINGLDDWAHPCQVLADFMTIDEHLGLLPQADSHRQRLKIAYLGDNNNNVTFDLLRGACLLGIDIWVAGPFEVPDLVIEECRSIAKSARGSQATWNVAKVSPQEAVTGADIVYTDSWMSYGVTEQNRDARMALLKPYQVNSALMALAKPTALFMHCMPALRCMEVTPEVMDGKQSIVFDQAENRLHVQKALMLFLLGKTCGPA